MQADKLKKKKGTINKGKVKKTIKNVICRPDSVFWPAITEDEVNVIETTLKKHRVCIPDFKRIHWNELKSIPKKERPKPPPIKKVDGLLFGISSCHNAIQNGKCSTVLIEALIEPQTLVQSILEFCISSNIPVICLKNLRIMTKDYFGIRTSCLGIEKDTLIELSNVIKEMSTKYKSKFNQNFCQSKGLLEGNKELEYIDTLEDYTEEETSQNKEDKLNRETNKMPIQDTSMDIDISYPYLFRTNKKTRVFVPNVQTYKEKKQFSGQQFIKISEYVTNKTDRKTYMNMILKKMSNNANRIKLKPNKG